MMWYMALKVIYIYFIYDNVHEIKYYIALENTEDFHA
jgi:hypothetical protein